MNMLLNNVIHWLNLMRFNMGFVASSCLLCLHAVDVTSSFGFSLFGVATAQKSSP